MSAAAAEQQQQQNDNYAREQGDGGDEVAPEEEEEEERKVLDAIRVHTHEALRAAEDDGTDHTRTRVREADAERSDGPTTVRDARQPQRRKAVVVIRGLAYAPSYVHFSGKRVNVDFRHTAESILKNVIRDLRRSGRFRRVDVVLVTYPNMPPPVKEELLRTYAPTRMVTLPVDPSRGSQRDVFLAALRAVHPKPDNDVGPDDVVYIIRFDTLIKLPFTSLRLSPDHINFMWHERPRPHDGKNGPPRPPSPPPSRRRPQARTTRPPGAGAGPGAAAARSQTIQTGVVADRRKGLAESSVAETDRKTPVCDVVHVFPARYAPVMEAAVIDTPAELRHLHRVFTALLRLLAFDERAHIRFAFDEGYDSNTDVDTNPVYHIVRPGATSMVAGHTPAFWQRILGPRWSRLT